MATPIISKDKIRSKAREAFARGAGRDEHHFNWHSTDAIEVWQSEWDRCQVARIEDQHLEKAAA